MSAVAERSLPVRTHVRDNSRNANVDAMGGRNGRSAGAVARSRSNNVRRNSSVRRSSRPRLRKPRGSGPESVAGAAAVEIVAKNRLRIRMLRLRSSSRVLRANRGLPARRRRRVQLPRERRRRVRKVTGRNAGAVFGVDAVAVADRKALRRQRSHARLTGSAHVLAEPWATNAAGRAGYASSVTISISVVPPI